MKLYSTLERHTLLPALCPSPLSARRVSPIVAAHWQDSVLLQDSVLVPAVPASVPAAPAAGVAAAVAAEATESVRVDVATVRGGKDEARIDVTVRIDELHVAPAALLDQRGIRVQGTNGFSAKQDMTAPKPNGGVRGIPPRGRPV